MVKVKVSITVEGDLLNWIDQQVENRVFANRSHAFETGIYHLKKSHGKDLRWILQE